MWELWVTLMAVGAWVLAAGSAGFAGSFLVQRLRDRQAAQRIAKDRFGPSAVERLVIPEPGVELATSPALAFARAGASSLPDREMTQVASTPA